MFYATFGTLKYVLIRPGLLCPLANPLGMRLAVNWTPYHLRDFRALFDEVLHGFRLDLIARSWKFNVNLSEDAAR
jgi:hypothetical protein